MDDTPAQVFWKQLVDKLRRDEPRLIPKAKVILHLEFGGRSVWQLGEDELKWFNGKVLRLLQRNGVVEDVRHG